MADPDDRLIDAASGQLVASARIARATKRRRVLALGSLAILGISSVASRAQARSETGLRWTGDARAAVDTDGAVLGGPTLRFRYGLGLFETPEPDEDPWADPEKRHRSDDDGALDVLVGSWVGFEASAGLLVGRTEPGRLSTVPTMGVRPWLSRRQRGWFLRTERFSVLGLLLPEIGAVFGLVGGPDWYLGWELPLGGEEFQVVPGALWISPGEPFRLVATLSFRVPM